MQAIISPGHISGSITPPASKSLMQRACAAALLHSGTTIIQNPGVSDDDKAALRIIQQLGATVDCAADNSIIIKSNGIHPTGNSIDCGESGLSARLFIPIAAMHTDSITVNGHGSLLKRPFDVYAEVLPRLSIAISSNKIPLIVSGPLQVKDVTLDGSVSSQFLSGLLFAFAYKATVPVAITVNNLNSKPYIDLTLDMLKHFGKHITHNSYKQFYVHPATAQTGTVTINIEADWSAAANFVVAKAIAGDISINNLNEHSLQADKAVLDIVSSERNAFEFDATDCPDLIPVLAIYAGCCHGINKIHGLERLIHKESNRVDSTATMLRQLGISFETSSNTFTITGVTSFESCTIDSHNDHRIAMAAAIAALYAKGDVTITNAQAVSKSYPDFFKDLSSVGVKCILKDE